MAQDSSNQNSSNQNSGNPDSGVQRISRLTPLAAVLSLIESRVGGVKPERVPIAAALGHTLAEDAVAALCPPSAIALRDGFAVDADTIADAVPYSPVRFPSVPRRINVGEPMPGGTDAVLPFDSVALRGDRAEAIGAVAAGEGVLPAGGDASSAVLLRQSGQRLRAIDVAVLGAAAVDSVSTRVPRIRIASAGVASAPPIRAAIDFLGHALVTAGINNLDSAKRTTSLDRALTETDADAVIGIGGTGSGQRDDAVQTLARLGRVEAHGIAISPGETAAFGFVGTRPVLLVPGRLDAALAVWLLIGRHLTAKLAGGAVHDRPATMPLKRKVTSAIGMTELIPVSCAGSVAEPLASGYLSFTTLAQSGGWIVVAADSEGFPAGAQVAVNPWS